MLRELRTEKPVGTSLCAQNAAEKSNRGRKSDSEGFLWGSTIPATIENCFKAIWFLRIGEVHYFFFRFSPDVEENL